jgi:hypothetical protein
MQVFGGDLRGRDHLEDLDGGGETILKWSFKNFDREA